jgi:hypothetical protein
VVGGGESMVFDHTHSWRWWWSNILLISAFYSTTVIPYGTAFPMEFAKSTEYYIIDALMYCIFAFEVLVNFNLDFVDIEGETIKNRKQIVVRYL